jgi:DnaJ-class molecular chaperone
MSSIKELECNRCEGKGYYNLSANYDDIDSRIECENCYGSGKKENEDEKTD